MLNTNRRFLIPLAAALLLSLMIPVQPLEAHCQIPCGIYDDHMRVKGMLEDAATVEKSVKLIQDLAGKSDVQSVQQTVRWVMNKEEHAQKIIATISDYFLTQRVKSSQPDYLERLKRHHTVITAAMSAKQTADMNSVQALKKAIEDLKEYYPEHEH